ncbi:MAG: helix-turn-helix domain-containing protein [Phycisphaera sp.]|nr:helix-turn-helix domain-containing protein [Phycisphaera sp.]
MLQIGIHFTHENFDNREAFRGICEFVRRHERNWRLVMVGRWKDSPDAYKPLVGGILATHDEATRRYIHDRGLPASSLSSRFIDPLLPQVWHDDAEVGRLAAEHLIQRGYRRFGWFGDQLSVTADRRRQGFIDALINRGFEMDRLVVDARDWGADDSTLLAAALEDDPGPIGCLAVDDSRGAPLVNACRDAGIDVPRRVGFVAANNATFICESSFPPLTSIELDMKGRGYEAARILARQLDGEGIETDLPPVPPVRLVARESTGYATTEDPVVDRAIAFIHANARREVRIEDVVRHAKTNRRTLTWKFRKALNTTPHQRIVEARIEAIKELLLTTDLDTQALTDAAGFVSRSHMSRLFKEQTGQTLIQFRNQSPGRNRKLTAQGHAGSYRSG